MNHLGFKALIMFCSNHHSSQELTIYLIEKKFKLLFSIEPNNHFEICTSSIQLGQLD
jgi:hypothetical protein